MVVAAGTVACGLLMLGGVGPTPGTRPAARPFPSSCRRRRRRTTTSDPDHDDDHGRRRPRSTATHRRRRVSRTRRPRPRSPESPPPVPLSVAPVVGDGRRRRCRPHLGHLPARRRRRRSDRSRSGRSALRSRVIPTGVTAAAWSYDWTAPPDAQPLVLQVWCGDPSGYVGRVPGGAADRGRVRGPGGGSHDTTPCAGARSRDPRDRLTAERSADWSRMTPTEIVQSTMPLCATLGITAIRVRRRTGRRSNSTWQPDAVHERRVCCTAAR